MQYVTAQYISNVDGKLEGVAKSVLAISNLLTKTSQSSS